MLNMLWLVRAVQFDSFRFDSKLLKQCKQQNSIFKLWEPLIKEHGHIFPLNLVFQIFENKQILNIQSVAQIALRPPMEKTEKQLWL